MRELTALFEMDVAASEEDKVFFVNEVHTNEEHGGPGFTVSEVVLELPISLWNQMEKTQFLTATIKVGDHLNGPPLALEDLGGERVDVGNNDPHRL